MENNDKYVEYLQENGASLFPITNSDLRFSIIQAEGSTSAILKDIESGVDKHIIEEIEPQFIQFIFFKLDNKHAVIFIFCSSVKSNLSKRKAYAAKP